ncbi:MULTISPECIES: sensor histidine kinase [Psychrilyobacter]|uniref:histidine kinase n=1 Tax=Psychrilyobacter piezotolerans TaxID=2293438 RepID=A0ABX9KG20_9FUSO|nr:MULTISPECIES: HAMP domain-containing sensor histidine kinase [Psychrilyobacter]MCS5421380.1 HAMP domain-containing histidine kinase [Psychrilyobacter sp. S5]NDI78466.1 HAMP domain-containing histidine kinase [Psychrilyobacter piezotolerans]RDE60651.1 sensor histidine kinase [Psychrilyobacter sp. S5]REI40578.1 sensor histidine kinase [Psychrilyobacter piezotolerans]
MKIKIKFKIYLIVLAGFLMGIIGFFYITKSLGDHYYIYRKKQFLRKQEQFIKDGSFRQVETVYFYEITLKENLSAFNTEIRKKTFNKNPQKYNIWFSYEDLDHVKRGYSVTRIFYQEDLNLAFLMRILKNKEKFYVLKTNIPSVKENFNFARELNNITFITIIIFLSIIFLFYSKILAKRINTIELNLNHIKYKNFHEIKNIDSNDEIGKISKLISEVAKETEKNLFYFENKAEEQKQFLRNFGHEIKTPLAIANGYTDILKSRYPEDSHLEIISKQLIRISKITRKFQDFSSGKIDLFFEDISVKDLIDIGEIFSEKYLNISYNEYFNRYEEIMIKCDIELAESLFYNLYSNAFNYCNSRVWTTLRVKDNFLIVEIGNDGEPIPAEKLDELWKPFFKLDNNSKGTGLGLSIVKNIINKHLWNIKLECVDNIIKFIIEIPLIDVEEE